MSESWTPVAIVTGAASGIGLATVHALLEHGASVVATDVSADALTVLDITGVALPVDGGVTANTGQAMPRFVPADELSEE